MTPAQRSILAVAMVSQGIAVGQTIGILPILLEPLESTFATPRTTVAAGQILIMLALTFSSIQARRVSTGIENRLSVVRLRMCGHG